MARRAACCRARLGSRLKIGWASRRAPRRRRADVHVEHPGWRVVAQVHPVRDQGALIAGTRAARLPRRAFDRAARLPGWAAPILAGRSRGSPNPAGCPDGSAELPAGQPRMSAGQTFSHLWCSREQRRLADADEAPRWPASPPTVLLERDAAWAWGDDTFGQVGLPEPHAAGGPPGQLSQSNVSSLHWGRGTCCADQGNRVTTGQ